jgi:peptidoglycan hydrolase-like amidase
MLPALMTIGVFGLFHPTELEVRPGAGTVILVESMGRTVRLEGAASARIRTAARVSGRDGTMTRFVLSVPGKIRREYLGRLEVKAQAGSLTAIVEMDRETAVGSIVAAEGPGAGIEAMKAQAVAARSFLAAAHGRHEGFDFCDTTHCQFLKEPAKPGSPAAHATAETRGLALAYQGQVFAALYSANCGGRTRTLDEVGWGRSETSGLEYPYFPVACPRKGRPSGHGVGLCQEGAAEMERHGARFREILNHYYPATTLVMLERP